MFLPAVRRGAPSWTRRAPLGLAAWLFAAIACGCRPGPAGDTDADADAVTLTLDELVLELTTDSAGTPMLVNFWATWCQPCVAELPALAEVAASRGDRLRVVTVSMDLAQPFNPDVVTANDVLAFLADRELSLEALVFDGTAEDLAEALDLPGPIPFTYAVNAAGERVAVQETGADHARFEAMAEDALRF